MRLTALSVLVGGVAGFVPQVAEWSAPLSGRTIKGSGSLNRRSLSVLDLTSAEQLAYDVNVTIGGQETTLLLDTGSFTLWTATPDYVCSNITNTFPHSVCGITGSYDSSKDSSAANITNAYFDASYGSGFAEGFAFNSTVTIAGLEVHNLSFGYANTVEFDSGDGKLSGILGLGLGEATGFYHRNISQDGAFLPDGLFDKMKAKLSAWQFAITFGRGISDGLTPTANTGHISFGGIASEMGTFKSSDFVTLNISSALKEDGYSYWGGTIGGFTYGNYTDLYQDDILVDSGTAYMIINPAVFDSYNALWTPNATFVPFSGSQAPGYYYVDCNATAPDFNIVVGSQNVVIPSRDLIYRTEDGRCRSTILNGENSPRSILGMPTFKSNIVVFDGDAQAVHFARKH